MSESKPDPSVLSLLDQWIAVYEDEQRHGTDHRRTLAVLREIRSTATREAATALRATYEPGGSREMKELA